MSARVSADGYPPRRIAVYSPFLIAWSPQYRWFRRRLPWPKAEFRPC